jgi:nuclear cap-binding protein subunit 1
MYANEIDSNVTSDMIQRAASQAQAALDTGSWREFKLTLRFLASLQGILENDGIFPLLDDLFSSAAELQAASQEDVSGVSEESTL